MTALVLTTVALVALALLDDHRSRRRLRRVFGEAVAPQAPIPRSRRRRRRPADTPSPIPSPLLLELLAALLESGAPPPTALRHLAAGLARSGDPRAEPLEALALDLEQGIATDADLGKAAQTSTEPIDAVLLAIRRLLALPRRPSADAATDPALSILREAVRMAALAGLPPAALIRRAATEERRRLGAARRRAIRRLEVILVLPVGLCLLPAFVLLGVIPIVIDLFSG